MIFDYQGVKDMVNGSNLSEMKDFIVESRLIQHEAKQKETLLCGIYKEKMFERDVTIPDIKMELDTAFENGDIQKIIQLLDRFKSKYGHDLKFIDFEKPENLFDIGFMTRESLGYPYPDWMQFDGLINNLRPFVIAGQAGASKTTVSVNMLYHFIFNLKEPCIFFSLELVAGYIVSLLLKIHLSKKGLNLSNSQIREITKTKEGRIKYPEPYKIIRDFFDAINKFLVVYPTEKEKSSTGRIVKAIERGFTDHNVMYDCVTKFENKTGFYPNVFVDYIQHPAIKPSGSKRDAKFDAIETLMDELTSWCKSTRKAYFLLSQLNRTEVANTKNKLEDRKKSQTFNMFGSSNIEHGAGQIVVLMREKNDQGQFETDNGFGIIHAGLKKNCFGEEGSCVLHIDFKTATIKKDNR